MVQINQITIQSWKTTLLRQIKDSMVTASNADSEDSNRQSATIFKMVKDDIIRNSINITEPANRPIMMLGLPRLLSEKHADLAIQVARVQFPSPIEIVGLTVPALLTELTGRQQNTVLADVDALRPVLQATT